MTSVNELVAAIGGLVERPYPLLIQVGDCDFRIACSQADTRQTLADYLQAFIVEQVSDHAIAIDVVDAEPVDLPLTLTDRQPEPGKSGLKEAWVDLDDGRVVRKTRTGMVFVFGGGTNLAIGPCCALPNQVVNFINNRQIERALDDGWQLLHAAGIASNGHGISLSGFAGKGKSTLALACIGHGATYVSNDRLLVDQRDGRALMHGVAKYPRINPGTALADPRLEHLVEPAAAARYRAMPRADLWAVEDKHDVPVEQIYGANRMQLAHQLDSLVVITWNHDAGPAELIPLDLTARADLFPAFTKDPGLFYLPGQGRSATIKPEAYRAALTGVATYELTGGIDIEAGAELLLALGR